MGSISYSFTWGCHYYLCIVDEFSGAIWVFLLKEKTETNNPMVILLPLLKPNLRATFKECILTMERSLPISHYTPIFEKIEHCMKQLV